MRTWLLGHGFHKPTPGERGWSARRVIMKVIGQWIVRQSENFDEPKCTRCGQHGHQNKWCEFKKKKNPRASRQQTYI